MHQPETMHDEILILTSREEKQRTRELYELVFEDSPQFVDYYYQEKCRDNCIIAAQHDGKIVSMVHLNPYLWNFRGNCIPAYYLVAVATHPDHRHRGYMRRVLTKAFSCMAQKEIPFCYLLPVDESIYRDFGFETVCRFSSQKLDRTRISAEYDLYCLQTPRYLARQRREEQIDEEAPGEALPQDPVIMMRIISPAVFDACAGLPAAQERTDSERLLWLRDKRIYVHETV